MTYMFIETFSLKTELRVDHNSISNYFGNTKSN